MSINSSQYSEGCIAKLGLGTQWVTGMIVGLKKKKFFNLVNPKRYTYIYICTFCPGKSVKQANAMLSAGRP